jgi:hypothetical protein
LAKAIVDAQRSSPVLEKKKKKFKLLNKFLKYNLYYFLILLGGSPYN